jgi:ArsR family transcriptional regulator
METIMTAHADIHRPAWQYITMHTISATPRPTDARDRCRCDQPARTSPDPPESHDLSDRLKALSDPTRLRIIRLLAGHPGGTACVCDLIEALGVTQPTVSHHMKILAENGLVTREQRGKWAHYTLAAPEIKQIAKQISRLADAPIRP